MKKNVSFEKKITFPTMIGEISAIDLEHTLRFIDQSNIEGDFVVKGKYKLTEASRLEEDFNYKIPTEIALSEKLDLNTTEIEISDFYYEIENDDTMICHIEVKIEGVESIALEEEKEEVRGQSEETLELERECDGDVKSEEEIEIPHKIATEEEIKEEIKEENEIEREVTMKEEIIEKEQEKEEVSTSEEVESISTIFSSLSEKEETFSTYSVYILREEETVNSIIDKYKTTKEELEKYNDLTTLTKGTKIIIPVLNND